LIILIGGLSFKYKNAKFFAVLPALLAIVHGLTLNPLGYYLQKIDLVEILGQRFSLRAHIGINYFSITVGIVLLIMVSYSIYSSLAKRAITVSLYHISVSNLKRKMFRSILLIICLSIVVGAFFSDMLITMSIENTLELGAGRLGADLMIVPKGQDTQAKSILLSGEPIMFFLDKAIFPEIKKYPEVEKISQQLYLYPFSYLVCCTVESVLVVAYDPDTDFTVAPWIKYTLRKYPADKEVVVGKMVKYYPGQKIILFDDVVSVVATLEHTGLGYFDMSAFLPIKSAKKLLLSLKEKNRLKKIKDRPIMTDPSFSHLTPSKTLKHIPIEDISPDGISSIMIKLHDNVDAQAFSKKITDRFTEISVVNIKESTLSVKRRLISMIKVFTLPVLVLMIMSTIILAVVFGMIVNERRREIGLFRAMGCKKSDIFKIIITEALLMSGLGGVLGIIIGSAIILVFKNKIMESLELLYIWPQYEMIITAILGTIGLSFVIGIISGYFPAQKASDMEPYQAIRSGE
jgi:putative ABC transport system permease protein